MLFFTPDTLFQFIRFGHLATPAIIDGQWEFLGHDCRMRWQQGLRIAMNQFSI